MNKDTITNSKYSQALLGFFSIGLIILLIKLGIEFGQWFYTTTH